MENQEIAWLLQEKYHGVESEAFYADVTSLQAGVPLAYLIGSIPFLDCTIYLDSHPLIPRPETEYWVEMAIRAIQNQSTRRDLEQKQEVRGETSNLRVLDLCAGSGAIGVAVARAFPDIEVVFAEIDPTHLPTIKKNLQQNVDVGYPNRLGYYPVIQSDIFSNIIGTFDFILTNPPYIDMLANTVDQNVSEYEPHLALFGGVAGMEIIARIINGARAKLVPRTGQLWIEHEPFQSDAIKTLAERNGFKIITHPDQYGAPRFSVLSM